MAISIVNNGFGGFYITQDLVKPVVYLDHWAIRLFSQDLGLQDRFISSLRSSKGTWLFSTGNLMEFTAMTDLSQAAAAEQLLERANPLVHFADLSLDSGYFLEKGAPFHPDAPAKDWLLRDLAERAKIKNGLFNTHRFIQDAISHRDLLQPMFTDLKETIANAVMTLTLNAKKNESARKFYPHPAVPLSTTIISELLREPHLDPKYVFSNHDAMDFVHAAPAIVACEYVLLDSGWCHKIERAVARMRKAGIQDPIAQCFSSKSVDDFLDKLSGWN